MKYVNALVAVALALGCGTVQAVSCPADTPIKNPGFECSSLTNGSAGGIYGWTKSANFTPTIGSTTSPWTTTGYGMSTYESPYGTQSPHFLVIPSGTFSQNTWVALYQSIKLAEGQTISGKAAFDWGDYGVFIDGARVAIFSGTTITGNPLATPFASNGADFKIPPNGIYPPFPSNPSGSFSNYYNGPWTPWSWTAPTKATGYTDGKYTLEYAVVNAVVPGYAFDASGSSYGLFDMMPIAVPEPASLSLFVIGLAGLSTLQRRRSV